MKEAKRVIAKTEKGRKTVLAGYNAEVLVKEKLWRYGYRVQHLNSIASYDLLVNNKIKVEVRSSSPKIDKVTGTIRWMIMFNKSNDLRFDVLVVVLFQPIGEPKILFYNKAEVLEFLYSPSKAAYNKFFEHKFSISKKEFFEVGDSSPYKTIGRPNRLSPA